MGEKPATMDDMRRPHSTSAHPSTNPKCSHQLRMKGDYWRGLRTVEGWFSQKFVLGIALVGFHACILQASSFLGL